MSENVLLVFSIKDKSRECFLAPFLCGSVEEAKRFIYQQINVDKTSLFAIAPSTYELVHIGKFNQKIGLLFDTKVSGQSPLHKNYGTFKAIIKEFEDDDDKE